MIFKFLSFRDLSKLLPINLKSQEVTLNNLNQIFKPLKQGNRYHKLRKAFSILYYQHSEFIVKFNICLKTLLQQDISESVFYVDLVYKFKRIVGKPNFSSYALLCVHSSFAIILKRKRKPVGCCGSSSLCRWFVCSM